MSISEWLVCWAVKQEEEGLKSFQALTGQMKSLTCHTMVPHD